VQYGKLIGAAFRIALRNPRLWPFGLFAATGGFGFNFNFSFDTGDGGDGSLDPDPALIAAIVIAVLALALLAAVFSVVSQGALTEGVVAAEGGDGPGFRRGLRAGKATFWRMAGLYGLVVALALAVLMALLVVAGGAVLATFAVTDAVALRVLVAVLAALAALAGLLVLLLPLLVIQQHAIREVALGGARPVAGLRAGWGVLRANVASSVVLLLIQQGLVVVGYTGVGLAALVLCLPAIVVLVATEGAAAGIIVAAVTALVVIPAALAAAGAVGTFGHGLWTLGYRRMVATPR
jgi:hypothetical protein